jgi:signal transduction histidine kinase
LYIAKTLVEIHGGKLGFDNAKDAGAVFYFDLPLLQSIMNDLKLADSVTR